MNRIGWFMTFVPIHTVTVMFLFVACQQSRSASGVYFSKDLYASEESGDMFGYELRIGSSGEMHSLQFIEYTGGGDPGEIRTLIVDINQETRKILFLVAGPSLFSRDDTLLFEGRLSGDRISGTRRFSRDTMQVYTELEFIRPLIGHSETESHPSQRICSNISLRRPDEHLS